MIDSRHLKEFKANPYPSPMNTQTLVRNGDPTSTRPACMQPGLLKNVHVILSIAEEKLLYKFEVYK